MMGANTPTIDAVDPVAKISDLEVYVVEAVKVEKFLKMAVYFLESYGASIGWYSVAATDASFELELIACRG